MIAGDVILTAALSEGGAADPLDPAVSAVAVGDGWEVSGVKPSVPWAHVADRVLVPARAGTDLVVVLVDPSGPGVTAETGEATDRQLLSHLTFDGAPGDVVACRYRPGSPRPGGCSSGPSPACPPSSSA